MLKKKLISLENVVLTSEEVEEKFEEIFFSINEKFEEFEADERNTCTSEWRNGYLVQFDFTGDCITITPGVDSQEIANQPEWFVEDWENFEEYELDGFFK